ncbi:DUF6653 family protein [Roseobacteraceae bacterium S113]
MVDLFKGAERAMGMSDAVWRRHANPWSGWTRFSALPLFCLAVWSRVWIGPWAWGAVAVALAWVWLNPRLFSEPKRWDAWMTRGVMGERVFLEHRDQIAAHHLVAARLLAWASAPGILVMALGLWAPWWEGVIFGMILGALPKVWFVDRMVWIAQDWQAAGRSVPGFEGVEHV